MNLGSQRGYSHDFMNPTVSLPTSTFNRPSQLKTAFNAGQLIPIFTEEVLPGDTHELKTASFGRFATLIRPILDNVYLDIHYFFVPNRILWDEWERFQAGNTGARSHFPKTTQSFDAVPTIKPSSTAIFYRDKSISPKLIVDGFQSDTLADYFGIPTHTGTNDLEVNCFYHRAYNKIYYDWYMDENFNRLDYDNPLNGRSVDRPNFVLTTDSTNEDDEYYPIQFRCKRRDYFTSCLPWSQKGQPVSIPLGGHLPLRGLFTSNSSFSDAADDTQFEVGTGIPALKGKTMRANLGTRTSYTKDGVERYDSVGFTLPVDSGDSPSARNLDPPYVDLGSNNAITVNELRKAVAIQRLLEKDARGGTRYVEVIKNHFGVTSPDYRLQRSEFLGSSSQLLDTSAVPQTSSTDSNSPQAHLASYGTTSNSSRAFKKTFTEHGVILGIASARVDQTYQQGLERRFSRFDRYDYYMPSLAHLGEQPVFMKELLYSKFPVNNDTVYGYIPRWDEYRFKQSLVTGAMRSNYVTYDSAKFVSATLDSWHLANDFPVPISENINSFLGYSFLIERPPIERVIATPEEKHFVFDFYFDLVSTRVMPITSVPSLVQKL